MCDANQDQFISQGKCKQCELEGCSDCASHSTCASCNETQGYYLDGDTCAFCNADLGQVIHNGGCRSCLTGCTTCTSLSSCQSCDSASNYFLEGDSCTICTLSNCVSCSSLTACQQCADGFNLENNQCVEAPLPGGMIALIVILCVLGGVAVIGLIGKSRCM